MTFTEEWFGEASQQALAALYGLSEGVGSIIEVGCWEGRSTIALANAAHPHPIYAVDTWAGSPGEISADLAAERDVYATFLANIDELTDGNVEVFRCGWRDFFHLRTAPIRFLHIDAEHTYREVHDLIEAALPYLEPGGVICGDDAHHPPVIAAVNDTLPAHQLAATLWWWRKP